MHNVTPVGVINSKKPYAGPFQIIEEVGRGVYRLQEGDKVIKQVVNATRLKLWKPPTSMTSCDKTKSKLEQSPPGTPLPTSTPPRTTSVGTPTTTRGSGRKRRRQFSSSSSLSGKTPAGSDCWVANLHLKKEDRKILDGGQWLNGRVMDAVNRLVASHLGGVLNQSTLLAQGAGGVHTSSV